MRPVELLNTFSAAEILDAMSRHIGEPDENGCIPWLGPLRSNGYGQFSYRYKHFSAHRAAYVAKHGPLPVELDACHKCDKRDCVNPDHIFPGTRSQNMRDCSKKKRCHAQTSPQTIARHEKHGLAKLTQEKAEFIRNSPLSQSALAEMFGVNQTTVGDVRRGKTWRNPIRALNEGE